MPHPLSIDLALNGNETLRDLDNFDKTIARLRLNPETLTSLLDNTRMDLHRAHTSH